jgi:hypothetical protein
MNTAVRGFSHLAIRAKKYDTRTLTAVSCTFLKSLHYSAIYLDCNLLTYYYYFVRVLSPFLSIVQL